MQTVQEVLERYGVDYASTMARVQHNKELYSKLLLMLLEDKNMWNLKEALEKDDMKGAFEAAHTLKGITGNLGLMPLFDLICAIVEPLRLEEKRSDYMEMYCAIEAEFQKVVAMQQELKEIK